MANNSNRQKRPITSCRRILLCPLGRIEKSWRELLLLTESFYDVQGLSLGLPTPIVEFQGGLLAVTLAADIMAVYHSQLPTGPPHQSTAYIKVHRDETSNDIVIF